MEWRKLGLMLMLASITLGGRAQSFEDALPPLGELIDRALQYAPQLKAQQSIIERYRYERKMNRVGWSEYVTARAGVHYGSSNLLNTVDNGQLVGSSLVNQKDVFYQVGVLMRLPFSQVIHQSSSNKVLELSQDQAVFDRRVLEDQIKNQVIALYQQINFLRDQIRLKAESLESNKVTYQIANKFFEQGQIPIEELNNIHNAKVAAENEFMTANYDLRVAYQQLSALVGGAIRRVMSILQFYRLLNRYLPLMLGCGTVLAVLVLLLTQNQALQYRSYALINTGLVSGYKIESQNGQRTDRTYTNSELENLINLATSYDTYEELGTRLLAKCLVEGDSNPQLIAPEQYTKLLEEIPGETYQLVHVGTSEEKTYQNLVAHRADPKSPIHRLLYSKHELFGVDHLKRFKVNREGRSDIIRIAYSTSDPGICKTSIEMLTAIFLRKHKEIKEGQTTAVLEFFQSTTEQASGRLQHAENALLHFREENKIINYYEQTRFISAKKEDLDELFHNEQMMLMAAISTLEQLENQLEDRVSLAGLNQNMLDRRQAYADLSRSIALSEITNGSSQLDPSVLQMRATRDALEIEMEDLADQYYGIRTTKDGLEIKEVLTEWLGALINQEKARARIQVIEARKKDFENIYNQFAPLGSTLKRIEREIDLAEREYLENLHSLNQARLHQHSMLMSTNLKVINPPFIPASPEPTKRFLMVILAGMAGFGLCFGTVVGLEYFDHTLKSPNRATEIVDLELVTAFPKIPLKPGTRVQYETIENRAMMQWLQQLSPAHADQPFRLVVLGSTRRGEGKTHVARSFVRYLNDQGHSALALLPHETFDAHTSAYNPRQFDVDQLNTVWKENGKPAIVLLEVPALLDHMVSEDLVKQSASLTVVARANRIWSGADEKAIQRFVKSGESKVQFVLNATKGRVHG